MTQPGIEVAPVAIVTGPASGIGWATARELAARGYRLGLLDRDSAVGEAANTLAGHGHTVQGHWCDVTDTAAIERAVEAVARAWGRIDAVAACAGVEVLGPVDELAESEWLHALDVNLSGVFRIAKATVPHLIESGGAFVAVASDAGVTGAQGYAAYTASKHGVVGLVRCLALDYGPRGVRSNAVCPAFVETPMAERIFASGAPGEREFYQSAVPLGRFARADEVAKVIAHLLSDEASYTNGLVYNIDGGSTAGYFVGASQN